MKTKVTKFAERHNTGPPSRLGQRFSRTKFLPEAGNTIVCHLAKEDPDHIRVLDARRAMMALPGAGQFLMTPEDSLHMTVSEGVIETRRTSDGWPPDLERTAPIDDVTAMYLERLTNFAPPKGFKVRVTGIYPMGLILEGATDADKSALNEWRARLAELLGFRHKEHDAYTHHMTFGYATSWLTDAEVEAWEVGLRSILEGLIKAGGAVPLDRPAFCTFSDMTRFEEKLILSAR